MYVVLANEVADVDATEFTKIGRFSPKVIAMPCVDLSVGLKGQRTSIIDGPEDCQNTLFLTFEPPVCSEDHEEALLNDPFRPSLLYRRGNYEYVELHYTYVLGLLSLVAYFLVLVEDCEFGYQTSKNSPFVDETGTFRADVDIAELWDRGLLVEIK